MRLCSADLPDMGRRRVIRPTGGIWTLHSVVGRTVELIIEHRLKCHQIADKRERRAGAQVLLTATVSSRINPSVAPPLPPVYRCNRIARKSSTMTEHLPHADSQSHVPYPINLSSTGRSNATRHRSEEELAHNGRNRFAPLRLRTDCRLIIVIGSNVAVS